MEEEQQVTKEDLAHVHKRIDDVETWLKNLLRKVEDAIERVGKPVVAAAAKVAEVVAPSHVAKVLEIVNDAIPCPKHPDAPQGVNGCTVPGCTFSPPAAP
jgi:hypothetical protein